MIAITGISLDETIENNSGIRNIIIFDQTTKMKKEHLLFGQNISNSGNRILFPFYIENSKIKFAFTPNFLFNESSSIL